MEPTSVSSVLGIVLLLGHDPTPESPPARSQRTDIGLSTSACLFLVPSRLFCKKIPLVIPAKSLHPHPPTDRPPPLPPSRKPLGYRPFSFDTCAPVTPTSLENPHPETPPKPPFNLQSNIVFSPPWTTVCLHDPQTRQQWTPTSALRPTAIPKPAPAKIHTGDPHRQNR